MNDVAIRVYPWQDCPENLKVLVNKGQMLEWVAVVPKAFFDAGYTLESLAWTRHTSFDVLEDPEQIPLDNGDVMLLGSV